MPLKLTKLPTPLTWRRVSQDLSMSVPVLACIAIGHWCLVLTRKRGTDTQAVSNPYAPSTGSMQGQSALPTSPQSCGQSAPTIANQPQSSSSAES